MQPSITSTERAIFKKRAPKQASEWKAVLALILAVLFLLAVYIDNFTTLTTVQPAHAQEVTTIHQNGYYCDQLAHGLKGVIVMGATVHDLKSVCPNLK